MIKVSISRLKDQLSAYLKKVEAGQTVIVTDRNKPIAQLSRVVARESEDERLARLIASGIVTPPKRSTPLSIEEIRKLRPVAPDARLLEALLEERESGW